MIEANVPLAMQGLGVCANDMLCAYHEPKIYPEFGGIGGSVFPPESVWGKIQLDEIAEIIVEKKEEVVYQQKLSTIEKIQLVLKWVNEYWLDHSDYLNNTLYTAWQTWIETAKKTGKYGAGSWAASPQQLSQLIEVAKVLNREAGIMFDDVLRAGTASGIHAQQEIFAFNLAGITEPQIYIVDICLPPLKESEAMAENGVGGTIFGSFMDLNSLMDNSWQVVTAHFIESFLPTSEQYQKMQMTSEQAFFIKKAFFQKAYDLLVQGGVFIQAIGTNWDDRRLHNPIDIMKILLSAGFIEENIAIVLTTDPFDYADGEHLPGNYFVIAQKGEV